MSIQYSTIVDGINETSAQTAHWHPQATNVEAAHRAQLRGLRSDEVYLN